VNYRVIKNLNFRLAGNLTRAELGNDVPGTSAKAGDQLLSVPTWTASASAEYSVILRNDIPAYARMDYSYTGSSTSLYDTTSPFYQSKAYSLVNLRLGTRQLSADSHWGASLFLDNAFNKIGQTSLPEAISADLQDTRRIGITRPRTIGINVKYQM
jgi:outer membrane receptor protein involved in Fe transport